MEDIFSSIKSICAALGDLLMPRRCVVCGCELNSSEVHLCKACLLDIPRTYFWQQSHNPMADKFNLRLQEQLSEGLREDYAFAHSLFFYDKDSSYRLIPQKLKYRSGVELGLYFGDMLACELARSPYLSSLDAIVPVPLHPKRHRSRGFNQAEILAHAIARNLHIPLLPHLIQRSRHTLSQTSLELEQKRKNVAGAFFPNYTSVQACGLTYTPRHLLLVDDTFTTGSTLSACHKALRAVLPHPVRISIATLAYVGNI